MATLRAAPTQPGTPWCLKKEGPANKGEMEPPHIIKAPKKAAKNTSWPKADSETSWLFTSVAGEELNSGVPRTPSYL